jgi:hypothetical protein
MGEIVVEGQFWGKELVVQCPICKRMFSEHERGCKHLFQARPGGSCDFVFKD